MTILAFAPGRDMGSASVESGDVAGFWRLGGGPGSEGSRGRFNIALFFLVFATTGATAIWTSHRLISLDCLDYIK